MCCSPFVVRDKKTAGSMQVPCGRCIACRLNRQSIWSVRLMNEKKFHEKSCFLTLTYNDENLPAGNTLVKADAQKFLKRLRKNTGKKIRFFLSGEYGEEYSRPHYHLIVFGLGVDDSNLIQKSWRNGFIDCGTVTDDSCRYVAKYILKKKDGDQKDFYSKRGILPEFSLMSRRPGIGEAYAKRYASEIAQRGFILVRGCKVSIPRYYVPKVFDSESRESLREERRSRFSLESRKERLDKIKEVGYALGDRFELDRRQKLKDELISRVALRKGKF